jgi:hypothetical protein
MRRREFMILRGAALVAPPAAPAQQPPKLARIGYISLGAGPTSNAEGFQI